MYKYSKIKTLFQRNKETFKVEPLLRKEESILALSYLKDIIVEEKIDGTNAQKSLEYDYNNGFKYSIFSRQNEIYYPYIGKDIMFIRETISNVIDGRDLKAWYLENFILYRKAEVTPDTKYPTVRIFGEVFGDKINKGIQYTGIKDYRNFRVFDIKIGEYWLAPKDRNDVCNKLGLKRVPQITILFQFPTYEDCYDMLIRTYNKSLLAKEYEKNCPLEGYVLRPQVALTTNRGRVMGKIKGTDYLTKKEYFEKLKVVK